MSRQAVNLGKIFVLGVIAQAIPLHAQLEPVSGAQSAAPVGNPLEGGPDVPGLPRVLIIGDSISIGYMDPVRAQLKNKANVYRPNENCGSTHLGLAHLDRWLGAEHWDVIHFNFGLHDLKYADASGTIMPVDKGTQVSSLAVYAANLRKIVKRLKQTGAKIIFATTTPVPPLANGRVEGDDRIYNEAAVKIMKEEGVAIDDLGGYVQQLQAKLEPLPRIKPKENPIPMRPGDIQQPYDVHYTTEGYRQLGDLVAASIVKDLPAPQK